MTSGSMTGSSPRTRAASATICAGTRATKLKLVRFLENHDEPRIASCLPACAERAAAVAIATLPGATLWHEGQFEGLRGQPRSSRAVPDEVPDVQLAG